MKKSSEDPSSRTATFLSSLLKRIMFPNQSLPFLGCGQFLAMQEPESRSWNASNAAVVVESFQPPALPLPVLDLESDPLAKVGFSGVEDWGRWGCGLRRRIGWGMEAQKVCAIFGCWQRCTWSCFHARLSRCATKEWFAYIAMAIVNC